MEYLGANRLSAAAERIDLIIGVLRLMIDVSFNENGRKNEDIEDLFLIMVMFLRKLSFSLQRHVNLLLARYRV